MTVYASIHTTKVTKDSQIEVMSPFWSGLATVASALYIAMA